MAEFLLDDRLNNDCHLVAKTDFALILLMNNSALPWFIIVPMVDVTEVCDLAASEQQELHSLSNQICEFIRSRYAVDKLNIGAIGNVVSQLHWHVIGRYKDDYCWPGVAWGQAAPSGYTETETEEIRQAISAVIKQAIPQSK